MRRALIIIVKESQFIEVKRSRKREAAEAWAWSWSWSAARTGQLVFRWMHSSVLRPLKNRGRDEALRPQRRPAKIGRHVLSVASEALLWRLCLRISKCG
jgi:hypothetical protein